MALCPRCKSELASDVTECYVCGSDLSEDDDGWMVLGTIEDKISADFARETLTAYEIPAVVFSRSGFFGQAGLPLNPFYSSESALFEVSVPRSMIEEAAGILDMAVGSKWQRKEEK